MDPDLLQHLMAHLRAAGAPQGMWLAEIAQVRRALAEADATLRRMEQAIKDAIDLDPPPEA